MADRLVVRGAREHNLKDVSLDLPRDALIVFTGLSGSGKSSLAFDTIFAEGQRRYVESLSAYARQFLGQMDKPDVDFIEGLSPGGLDRPEVDLAQPALDGRHHHRGLRLPPPALRPRRHAALPAVRPGHRPPAAAARSSTGSSSSRRAPASRCSRRSSAAARASTSTCSPTCRPRATRRARVDGVVHSLAEPPKLKKQEKHTIEVVVDRLTVKESAKRRLTDSVETALSLGGGLVVLDFVDKPEDDPERERTFSEHLACLYDDLSFEELEPRSFSFNSPFGACPECHGLGTRKEVDPELVITDEEASFEQGVIAPWIERPQHRVLRPPRAGARRRARLHAQDAVEEAHQGAAEGRPATATRPRCTSATATATAASAATTPPTRASSRSSSGATSEAESDDQPRALRGLHARGALPGVCQGARLKPEVLAVTLGGRSIAEVAAMSIGDCADVPARASSSTDRQKMIAERVAQGGQRPAGLPARRRPRLPLARPRRRHPRRRRGAAHPAGHPDRLRPGRRALRPRRAVDRPAPARQPPAHRHAAAAARRSATR